MKTISRVQPGEEITHKGDLVIDGDVGSGACIRVRDGALDIKGDVEANTEIILALSEEYRSNRSARKLGGPSVGNDNDLELGILSIGSRCSVTDASGRKMSANHMMTFNNRKLLIGNVNIHDRIFANAQVENFGDGVYKITKPDNAFIRFVPMFAKTGSEQSSNMVKAKIDGTTYIGGEIYVLDSKVYVDGKPAVPGETHCVAEKKAAPEKPLKLRIKGHTYNGVSIISDAKIEANSIGSNCTIKSLHNGISAKNVGNDTVIFAHNAIELSNIGNDCKIESKQYGLTAGTLGCSTNVAVRDAINVGNIRDLCTLTSQQYGINAENVGQIVTINVRDKVTVGNVGSYSSLSSKQDGLKARNINDYVTIDVWDGVSINSIGNNCVVSSRQYGIDVANDVATCCKLEARDDIHVGAIGDYTQLKSKHGNVKVVGQAGSEIKIQARDRVGLKDVGYSARIISTHDGVNIRNIGKNAIVSARDDIDIKGTCPAPESLDLNSRTGKVYRPEKATITRSVPSELPKGSTPHPMPNSYSTGNYENDLALAIEASKSDFAPSVAKLGTFGSTTEHKHKKVKILNAYLCPITFELMKDPVICKLDEISYERAAITEWLSKHRNSPITRAEMASGQTIENVLLENRTLADAIEEFKETNPGLFSENKPAYQGVSSI